MSNGMTALNSVNPRLFIDGEFVDSRSGRKFETTDPATENSLTEVAEADPHDTELAVRAARRAFEHGEWSRTLPKDRERILLRLADLLDDRIESIAILETLDNGMPLRDAEGIVHEAAQTLRYFAGWSTKIQGRTMSMNRPGAWHSYTLREPIGVVGQIVPWNFPLLMAIWKIAPALAAGNAVVLKPAEQTPLAALKLAELASEAGLPGGALNVIPGFGGIAGAALAAHPDVDKITFTGSNRTGRKIVEAALGNFKKIGLELGGKSPNIVFADADLHAATAAAAQAIFSNSGQVCTAGSRLYVERGVFEHVVRGLKEQANRIAVGPGMDASTEMGPLVSEEQLTRVSSLVDSGVAGGAEVIAGGHRLDRKGYFYAPTVLADATEDSALMQEEIFGPVVIVTPFDDAESIGTTFNNTKYGLAAGVWSRNVSRIHRVASALKAGTVYANTYQTGDPGMPFGGFLQSGWGRELGQEGLENYTETKSVILKL